jgi:hypothetical protein
MPNTPRAADEYHGGAMLPAASAAAALAQLHNHKLEPDWESEGVSVNRETLIDNIAADNRTGLYVGQRSAQAGHAVVDRAAPAPGEQDGAHQRTLLAHEPPSQEGAAPIHLKYVSPGQVVDAASDPEGAAPEPPSEAVALEAGPGAPAQEAEVPGAASSTTYEL